MLLSRHAAFEGALERLPVPRGLLDRVINAPQNAEAELGHEPLVHVDLFLGVEGREVPLGDRGHPITEVASTRAPAAICASIWAPASSKPSPIMAP